MPDATTSKLFLPPLRTIMKGLEDATCPQSWYIIRSSSSTKREQGRKNYDAHATEIKKTNLAVSCDCFALSWCLSEIRPIVRWSQRRGWWRQNVLTFWKIRMWGLFLGESLSQIRLIEQITRNFKDAGTIASREWKK
jgi:hypothetical protein